MKLNRKSAILVLFVSVLAIFTGAGLLGAFPVIPNPGSSDSNTVSWDVKLSHPYVEKGSNGEVLINMKIKGRDIKLSDRSPVNLVLVIDRSGSMSEKGKIEYAKKAANQIIAGLGAEDRLSVVAYSTDVQLLYPIQFLKDKDAAQSVVNSLYPTNSTNLSGGLTTGIGQLASLNRDGYINRVILLSDGLANAGITDMGQLNRIASDAAEKGIHVTTMGLGLSYDENLMMSLAEYGAGNYYFIESPTQLVSIFNREFGEIAATVAKDPTVTLSLAPGVIVQDVYGYTYKSTKDGNIEIKLGDVFGGQERDILIKLKAPAKDLGVQDLATAAIKFDDLVENKNGVGYEERLSYNVTEDKRVVEENEDKDVITRGVSVDSASDYYRATTEYEKGNFGAAKSHLRRAYENVKGINQTPQASKETYAQEMELEQALDMLDQPEPPAPTSDKGKKLIKQNKAEARQQQK